MGLEYDDGHSLVPYKSFTPFIRQELKDYIQMGGALILSGAYLGSDMQSDTEKQYMNSVLKCNYIGRNLSTSGQVTGMGTTLEYWNQLNSTHYAAVHTDILQPVAPAFTVMQYADGNDAAIACKSPSAHLFVMGFPFECIKSEQQRNSIMQGILNYLFK